MFKIAQIDQCRIIWKFLLSVLFDFLYYSYIQFVLPTELRMYFFKFLNVLLLLVLCFAFSDILLCMPFFARQTDSRVIFVQTFKDHFPRFHFLLLSINLLNLLSNVLCKMLHWIKCWLFSHRKHILDPKLMDSFGL